MKKLITIILILAMLPVVVLADIPDISGLNYNELIQLRDQLNIAIWGSKEWKEITVPSGIWVVGEDIPAGEWTITVPNDGLVQVFYCEKVNEAEKLPDHSGSSHTVVLCGPKSGFVGHAEQSVAYRMEEGWFFINEGTVIFQPYIKPDLGFN